MKKTKKYRIGKKRGISEIITTVIMIGLVLALIAIVWAVVNSLVTGKLKSSQSCFGNFNLITINSQYTCYNLTSGEFDFSIARGDVDVDKVIVSISAKATLRGYPIPGNYTDVKMYGGSYSSPVSLPDKNGGFTYVTNDFSSAPDSIKIAPVINGNQCDVSDELDKIENC
jgi:flagellin-like protein